MSQGNLNSQPPNSPDPRRKRYPRPQPFWKTTIIQFLRGTIGVLEVTVDKLETEPSSDDSSATVSGGILNGIRSLLPVGLASQLSDTALGGAIVLVAVVLIWGTTSIFTGKTTEIAKAPEIEPVTPTISTPEATITPTVSPPIAVDIEPSPPIVEETPVVEATEEPIEEVPEPIPTETPTPVFVPLTPEQTLIASIENRISEVSDRVSSGIIKSTQANFATSSLVIKVSDQWYDLKPSQQDKLALEMFQRSQELDFSHLEIVDILDRLVARNPVIGTEMIIFKRDLNQPEQA
ncbi:hypothetical protein [Calothrix sp. PCC 6303]|uniref:hypothetical protein n=1 Tax=Calothrix sp. PCC 6303 TaxID=1170562 RepID=UPI0002A0099F|nr:hypothetical protein [Calothrix sp. PCC 6303]AFZ02902.1 hypothetical protein Cal6303_3986 [Calothrix sp. PCC 6303]